MSVLTRADLAVLLARAAPARLPRSVTLDAVGTAHWIDGPGRGCYFLFAESRWFRVIRFELSRHGGAPTRTRRCELCGRFVEVYRLYALRSVCVMDRRDGRYLAKYSYICRSVQRCREHTGSAESLRQFVQKHRAAAQPTLLFEPLPNDDV